MVMSIFGGIRFRSCQQTTVFVFVEKERKSSSRIDSFRYRPLRFSLAREQDRDTIETDFKGLI